MDSELAWWFIFFYNQQEHHLNLGNCRMNIGYKGIMIDDIKDIVQDQHINHQ